MLIKLAEGVLIDTDTSTYAQLAQAKDTLDRQITSILFQIEEAKANHHATGDYADPLWYARANHALRIKRKDQQKLQQLLRIHQRAENVQSQPLSQFFLDICRERMDKELFESILTEARSRKENAYRNHIEEQQNKKEEP